MDADELLRPLRFARQRGDRQGGCVGAEHRVAENGLGLGDRLRLYPAILEHLAFIQVAHLIK